MYSLIVKKNLRIGGDGGINYMVGHDCTNLDAFEVAFLLTEYPKHFEPADDLTKDFASNKDNMKHLAQAMMKQG